MAGIGDLWRSGSRVVKFGNSLDNLVHAVCQRSAASVEERLCEDLAPMTAAELRGYVRARAFEPIRTLCDEFAATHRLSTAKTQELFQRALERTAQLIAREQKAGRPGTVYQAPLRLAG